MDRESAPGDKQMDQAVGRILIIAGICLLLVGVIPIMVGFGPIGITAGSIAAGIQSVIGNVAAGSAFAHFTSMGMLGVFQMLGISGALSLLTGLCIKFKWEIYFGWKRFTRSVRTWWDDCLLFFRIVGYRFRRWGGRVEKFFQNIWKSFTK